LQVGLSTVNRDISYLRNQAKDNIKKYIDESLPEAYEKCLVGLNAITKEAWNTAHNTEDKREKIHALSLAKECYSMKLDLLTNATNFNSEHKAMLGHCKMILEKDGSRIAINPDKIDKLITALRTAVDNDGTLNKEPTSYNDIFDAFRLALKFYYFKERITD